MSQTDLGLSRVAKHKSNTLIPGERKGKQHEGFWINQCANLETKVAVYVSHKRIRDNYF